MADMSVDTVQMRQGIRQAEEKLAVVNEALRGLGNCFEDLNDSWTGSNHDEFVQNYIEEHERMEALDSSVREYLESLETAALEYEKCSDDMEDIVAKVRV
jgi:uncharacterized protein YukE